MKKNTILVIVISVIILSSIGITFYFLNSAQDIPNTTGEQPIAVEGSAFPVSNSSSDNIEQQNNFQNENENIVDMDYPNVEQSPESAMVQIKMISDTAVAGMTFINKNGQNVLRYIEKGNGNIKEIAFDETIPTNVTNTTVTSIFDSFWGKDGESLIFRRLEGVNNEIQTIFGVISNNSELVDGSDVEIKKLDTTLLPQNTLDVAVSPDKNKVLYLVRESGGIAGLISDFNKNGVSNPKTQIWRSSIKEWSVSWPSLNNISLLTKPSSGVKGYLYSLTTNGNQFKKIISGIPGLTAIRNLTGDKLIYSETTGTGFLTYRIDDKEEGMDIFPVRTIPEKCVFSKINENVLYCGVPNLITGSKYPDSWYQGLISFSDSIYKIDLDVNFAGIIASREKIGGNGIDLINPILSDDENYLAFINKKDSTLWMVKIR